MFELVADCVRAGLKKTVGRGGAPPQPTPAGGLGGQSPSAFANLLAFPPRKSFEKRLWSINSSNNNNNTIEIIKAKI